MSRVNPLQLGHKPAKFRSGDKVWVRLGREGVSQVIVDRRRPGDLHARWQYKFRDVDTKIEIEGW
jgi:hypothetical protein